MTSQGLGLWKGEFTLSYAASFNPLTDPHIAILQAFHPPSFFSYAIHCCVVAGFHPQDNQYSKGWLLDLDAPYSRLA